MPTSPSLDLKYPERFFINGEWVDAATDGRIQIISPATEQPFYEVASAQEADVNRAVAAARQAFDHGPWPRMSPAERAPYLRAIGAELAKRADGLSQIWAGEMGALYSLGLFLMPTFEGIFQYYAGLADTFPFIEKHQPMHGGAGYLVREPVGVVGAIVPWNGPLMLASWKVAPALLAGCTLVLKASPEAPGTIYALAEAAEAAGLPPGVLNVITARRGGTEALVRHPGVDKVSFTGSTAVGKKIGAAAGERIARCTLELGGKSPAIVLDDYDVETFARNFAMGAPALSGQVCAALTRVIVSRKRHDALVEALAAEFKKIRVGDPFDSQSQMGPVAMERQRATIEGYIAKGIEQGATLAAGGGRPKHLDRGYYVEPTVFGNVDNNAIIAREEIFGPVISVIPADSEDHAIDLANDNDFGLNSSVYTNDSERAFRAARRLRIGTVGQNGAMPDFSIAFGGFKQSGIGREGGKEGLMPYLETKTILLEQPVG